MALIVVADDEYLLATILTDLLEEEGHEVHAAFHGEMALSLVREKVPALLITDFMMPIMTGMELARAIRADADLATLPILLISGAQGMTARDHPELFDRVLEKPYDPCVLMRVVGEMLAV